MIRRVTISVPEWLYKKTIGEENVNRSQRVTELLMKGFLMEQEELIQNQKFKNKKDSEVLSKDKNGSVAYPEQFSAFSFNPFNKYLNFLGV